MENFCRAPIINGTAFLPDGPWCFTESGPQYCTIPHCSVAQLASKFHLIKATIAGHGKEISWYTFTSVFNTGTRQCLKGNGFMSYAGNYTIKDECLPWTNSAVHLKGFKLWMFPGSDSWIEMQDYCRNPDNDEGPWCYNRTRLEADGVLEKLYCDSGIPACCKLLSYDTAPLFIVHGSSSINSLNPTSTYIGNF